MLTNIWNWFVNTHIGDLPTAFLGGVIGFILVFVIERLRSPKIELEVAKSLEIKERFGEKDGKKYVIPKRRILKLEVTVISGWRQYLPISKNIHAFSKIKVKLDWRHKSEYQAKWDNAPEPYDYINDVPKLEMTPLTMQPENLMLGDTAQAGIAVKNEGDDGFYFFDADYYVNPQNNYCTKKRAVLRITFKSSLTEKTENFIIKNPNSSIDRFILEKENSC